VSNQPEMTYAVDFCARQYAPPDSYAISAEWCRKETGNAIPRIARLMALSIRFDLLVRDETIRDYAELARRGHVTRARMTQIMKLLNLAPDIQEQILFLPAGTGINERNLRPLAGQTDWRIQRCMFQKIRNRFRAHDSAEDPLVPGC